MKQTKKQDIPIHRMNSQSLHNIEFSYREIKNGDDEVMVESNKNMIHRDDYYMFLFLNTSGASMIVDFEEMQIAEKENCVLYVRPGQVHYVSSIQQAKGWFLAIDPMLVEKSYKAIFERQFRAQKPITLNAFTSTRLEETSRLLHTTIQAESTIFSNGIILNLINVFIGIIAEQYASQQENPQNKKSRSALIAYQFRELLAENFKTLKSPTEYAKRLNYSLSHLNESVKETTGFPISYWIHQQVVLEAKRLLYYTDMDVKEIAFSLGYEDHTYFSRLFSKIVGVSPGAFRNKLPVTGNK